MIEITSMIIEVRTLQWFKISKTIELVRVNQLEPPAKLINSDKLTGSKQCSVNNWKENFEAFSDKTSFSWMILGEFSEIVPQIESESL